MKKLLITTSIIALGFTSTAAMADQINGCQALDNLNNQAISIYSYQDKNQLGTIPFVYAKFSNGTGTLTGKATYHIPGPFGVPQAITDTLQVHITDCTAEPNSSIAHLSGTVNYHSKDSSTFLPRPEIQITSQLMSDLSLAIPTNKIPAITLLTEENGHSYAFRSF